MGARCVIDSSGLPERCDDREYSSGWRRMAVESSAPTIQCEMEEETNKKTHTHTHHTPINKKACR